MRIVAPTRAKTMIRSRFNRIPPTRPLIAAMLRRGHRKKRQKFAALRRQFDQYKVKSKQVVELMPQLAKAPRHRAQGRLLRIEKLLNQGAVAGVRAPRTGRTGRPDRLITAGIDGVSPAPTPPILKT